MRNYRQDPRTKELQAVIETIEFRDLVYLYIRTKAASDVMRTEIDKIENEILQKFEWKHENTGERITELKDFYYLSVSDMKRFCKISNEFAIKAGLKSPSDDPEICPALVLENDVLQLSWKIINQTAHKAGLTEQNLSSYEFFQNMQKYIDLVVKAALCFHGTDKLRSDVN